MAKRINEKTGMGGEMDDPLNPTRPSRARMQWKPPSEGPEDFNNPPQDTGEPVPIKIKRNPRFDMPGPAEKPQVNYLNQNDLDILIARIRAEETQPPHKQNAALIHALKQQALHMMQELESTWVQQTADALLPRLDESYTA